MSSRRCAVWTIVGILSLIVTILLAILIVVLVGENEMERDEDGMIKSFRSLN